MGRGSKLAQTFCLGLVLICAEYPREAIAQSQANRSSADQAQQLYHTGQYRQAFQAWQKILDREPLSPEQQREIEVNQGLALQQLGQLQQACLKFTQVLEGTAQLCQRDIAPSASEATQLSRRSSSQFFSAIFLSQILWDLGRDNEASALMQQVVDTSLTFQGGRYRALALLEQNDLKHRRCKAGVEQSFLVDEIALLSQKLSQTLQTCQQVLQTYQRLFDQEAASLQSQVHWLELYLTLQRWSEKTGMKIPALLAIVDRKQAEASQTWERALNQVQQQDSAASVTLELQLIRQGIALSERSQRTFLRQAFDQLKAVLSRPQSSGNPKAQAIAYQLLGDLYQTSQQWHQAETAYRTGLDAAEQIEQAGLATQLHQNLARIYLQTGQPERAIQSYEQAIQGLRGFGTSYAARTNSFSFSFQEQVEALHHDYMQVLLQQSNPDYRKVVEINDQLRVKELIHYLRCGVLELKSLTQLPQQQTPTHFIHILQLGQTFHVVAQLSSGKFYHYQPHRQRVEQSLNRLLLNLKSDTFALSSERSIQASGKLLYNEFLGPIRSQLERDSTLVFSLDSRLHRLPMALLYDGQQYLFENFQLSTNFGLRIATTETVTAPLDNVLVAGLSATSPSFQQLESEQLPPLISVKQEAEAIAGFAERSDILLNQSFTLEQLQQRLYRQDFPYVHIATHGSFSSNPEETYLLAWDQKIQLPEFERLLQTLRQQGQALALLVLSACETAQGDRRAALGLAGLATQSGAQTTVASLWRVDDQATAQFMTAFYRALAKGQPKARALRQAQTEMRQSDTYRSPYYWAPFILLGDWR